jgi:N-acetylneuraminic acid mutarotase
VVAAPDGRIYAIGGVTAASPNGLNVVESFDPSTNKWDPAPPLQTARYSVAAAVGGDGRIYAIGGFDGTKRLTVVEAYAPGSTAWVPGPPLETARSAFGAASVGGTIYAVGGYDGTKVLRLVEGDPPGGSWSMNAMLLTARAAHGVVAGSDGRIYALGGLDISPPGLYLDAVEAYTPANDSWATVAPMPTARGTLAAAVDGAGRIYALGGYDATSVLSTLEVYTPAGVWLSRTPMPSGRTYLGAAAGSDGRIYAIGGSSSKTAVAELGAVEAYVP